MFASRFAALLTLLIFAAAAYAAPADLEDGLLVAEPADVSLFRAPLETLTPAVVTAEFPDTTSVLVFKGDRLVLNATSARAASMCSTTRARSPRP